MNPIGAEFPNIFEYKEYKDYLRAVFMSGTAESKRGSRSEFARALGCQLAYVSRVLNEDANLSLEQADRASQYFGHNKLEARFFLGLVSLGRAGTESLKKQLQDQLDEILEKNAQLKSRVPLKQVLSKEAQQVYYSAWYYTAIHMLTAVPGQGTPERIAHYLQLKKGLVMEVLEFLLATGLVVQENGLYRIGTTHVHLDAESPLASKHHMSWRMKAIQNLEYSRSKDLHYSSVVSMAREDIRKLRLTFVEAIERARKTIRESKEETLVCYSVDLFAMGPESEESV